MSYIRHKLTKAFLVKYCLKLLKGEKFFKMDSAEHWKGNRAQSIL